MTQGWLLAQDQALPIPTRRGVAQRAPMACAATDAYLRRLQARATDACCAEAKPFEQQFADHFRELVQADPAARA